MVRSSLPVLLAVVLAGLAWTAAATAAGGPPEDEARAILQAAGVRGGLVVHLGCGDGTLTAALRAGEAYLVHGLSADAAAVAKARDTIAARGLYGRVAADAFDGTRLPYVDNLVNLVVAGDLGGVPMAEVLRVLAPEGVAYVRTGGAWRKTVKPRPADIDEWTHFLHGPDGNAVARDAAVGFPHHVQWVGSPEHSRDHEITTSMDVMVTAGGRLFYIMDEGPTALPYHLPARWNLVARDAFNGVVLWRRPLADWRPHVVHGRTSLAADLWRRLVAAKDEVYVTSSIFGPVIAVEAASGEIRRTYEGTDRTEEIVHDGGVLYLVATTAEPDAIDRRALAVRRATPDAKRLLAVDAASGRVRWTKQDKDTAAVHPLTLAVKGGRVFFQNTDAVVCLDAATGKDVWRFARPSAYAMPGNTTPTLVVHDDVVLSADRAGRAAGAAKGDRRAGFSSELIALSAETGRELWRCPCNECVGAGVDVFVAGGLVWVGETPRRNASDYNHGRDLHTGEIKKTFSHDANWPTWHHHRCYRDKATEKYILAGRTGIEFCDLETGDLTAHHWVRGICEYGILPANGLIYSPPDQCACYIESRLQGFVALAPKRSGATAGRPTPPEQRLETGPAYGRIGDGESDASNAPSEMSDWPTLRRDNRRSGCVPADLPLDVRPAWTAALGGRLTALTSADGCLFVAQPDMHTVLCLDAATGEVLWRYRAGGVVDSPPAVASGIAVFGCRDGRVVALRAADGAVVWRFQAAPEDLRLVEAGQVASVWPVHGSVMIEDGCVYVAAGRASAIGGGMYLYQLDLATGRPLLQKQYASRDPETGTWRNLFTPYDAEVLPDRELPGLLPDVFSSDGAALYLRSVPLDRRLVIQDKHYVPHLFSSMGFLEDTWWERTYWIYGVHFYSGARGHGYARTLFPAGRLLVFDETSVYGYQDAGMTKAAPGIFRVAKNPEFVDLASALRQGGGKAKRVAQDADADAIARTFVWKNGVPQNPKAMNMTASKTGAAAALLGLVKYKFDWYADAPLLPNAMLLAGRAFWTAGPPRFREDEAAAFLAACRTEPFELSPLLRDALDTFEGRKGGLVVVTDKADGKELARLELPSSPVFDGMIAARGRLFLALKDGSVVCLAPAP